jgi:hypothetical protein
VAVLVTRATAPKRDEAAISADFADVVAGSIDGPVLRYTQRQVLIRDAERRGIGRFEANLIIAAVLYRQGMGQEYEIPAAPGGLVEWVAPVLTFVALQAAIVAGAWWVLR